MNNFWKAQGYNPNHDYHPSWDYDLSDMSSALHNLIEQSWKFISKPDLVDEVIQPCIVYQVAGLENDLARFISGTESAPVIVIDWDQFQNKCNPQEFSREIILTLLHELRHAWQDEDERLFNPQWAEEDAEQYAQDCYQQLYAL